MDACADLPMILRSTEPRSPVRVNRSFTAAFGLEAEALSESAWVEWIHSDDREALQAAVEAGAGHVVARHRTSHPLNHADAWKRLTWRVQSHDDHLVLLGRADVEVHPFPIEPRVGTPAAHSTMSKTLRAMALIFEAKNPGLRCSILLINPENQTVMLGAGPSLPDEYNQAVEGLRIGPFVGSCGTASFWNVPVIVENIAEDSLWVDLRSAAALASVAACWSFPITATDGSVLGAMALYDTKPSTPSAAQMDGLEMAARMVGLAIERDRLEDELRQATKMEALGVLAGGIAHDFNNLLTTVLCNAELAANTLPDESPARKMIQDIVGASTNATDLCSQMLAYSGRGTMQMKPLDLNRLVGELGSLLQIAVPKKVEFRSRLSAGPEGVTADETQLRQVIMNLITNAAQSLGGAVGKVTIETTHRAYTLQELKQVHPTANLTAGDYVQLRVTDTGLGVSPTVQARIFDPFYTTKSTGSGLGLAAVQGIVRAHQGAIRLESTPNVGTTFTVLLPRTELAAEIIPATPPDNPVSRESVPQKSARILVVDDEDSVRRVIAALLERGGYTVVHARDGREALDVLRRESQALDCVLLDYSMPNLDGEEVLVQMRDLDLRVPVVLTSGFLEQQVLDRIQGLGIAGFLQKPPRKAELLGILRDALTRSAVEA